MFATRAKEFLELARQCEDMAAHAATQASKDNCLATAAKWREVAETYRRLDSELGPQPHPTRTAAPSAQ
jgi:hypothetical protein